MKVLVLYLWLRSNNPGMHLKLKLKSWSWYCWTQSVGNSLSLTFGFDSMVASIGIFYYTCHPHPHFKCYRFVIEYEYVCLLLRHLYALAIPFSQSQSSLHSPGTDLWSLVVGHLRTVHMWCKNHTEPRLTSLNPRFVQIFLPPMPVTSRTYQSSHYVPDPAEARRSTILGDNVSDDLAKGGPSCIKDSKRTGLLSW